MRVRITDDGADMTYPLLAVLLATMMQGAWVPTSDADIGALSAAFDEAQFEGDRAALDRFLAKDMVFVRGSGVVTDRNAFIAAFTSGTQVLEPFVITDRMFLRLGADAAIVGGKGTIKGTDGGKPFSDTFWFADTFARRDGEWKVVYVQVTRLPTP